MHPWNRFGLKKTAFQKTGSFKPAFEEYLAKGGNPFPNSEVNGIDEGAMAMNGVVAMKQQWVANGDGYDNDAKTWRHVISGVL